MKSDSLIKGNTKNVVTTNSKNTTHAVATAASISTNATHNAILVNADTPSVDANANTTIIIHDSKASSHQSYNNKERPFDYKTENQFHSIDELIFDLKNGKMIILVDDEDRENEGDLVLPSQFATSQNINFMALYARGLICLAMSGEQADRLALKPMVGLDENQTPNKTAFTVSIEAAHGVSTGISAADRAHTILVASDPKSKSADVRSPGHVFPIRARQGGVLKRAGHTEGSVDLMLLSGLRPSAVICEIMNDDGSMARVPELKEFAQKHDLKIGTIADLIEYRLARETLVKEVTQLPSFQLPEGWKIRVFESLIDGWQHLVFQKGEITLDQPIIVRVQQEDFLKVIKEPLMGQKSQLETVFEFFTKLENGLILFIRGQGSYPQCAHRLGLQFAAADSHVSMEDREYGLGAQILRACGVTRFKLLAHHSTKKVALKAFGLELTEIIQLPS